MKWVNCLHQYVQVHVGIHKVCPIGVSMRDDWHGKQPTIKVGAVRGHWWNCRKRRIDCGSDLGIVW